eukprot:1932262-Pleurochrysis_carterae.AAC.2
MTEEQPFADMRHLLRIYYRRVEVLQFKTTESTRRETSIIRNEFTCIQTIPFHSALLHEHASMPVCVSCGERSPSYILRWCCYVPAPRAVLTLRFSVHSASSVSARSNSRQHTQIPFEPAGNGSEAAST